ncbi:MAG: flagellar M-ring protein FliF [Candidatus Tectomicrobia bacterium]|nr:flagellar M-ring protein FliF [Candidatus Tectomicrobia bacterium]
MGFFHELMSQVQALLDGLSFGRKLSLLLVGALTLGGFVALFLWSSQPHLRIMYRGLDAEDAAAIVEQLRTMKVPYQIADNGATILAPAERLSELRLQLASAGYPRGGGVGFELFDKMSFGATEFVQKLNYRRALQGELARTIGQLESVERARVHIVVPEPSLFVRDAAEARASVILQLRRGQTLQKRQVAGIVHLVASSVEGLKPEKVTVVNQQGQILAGGETGDMSGERLSGAQLDLQADLERKLERRIETMLGGVMGAGKVLARVAVELNAKRVERTEENYDPDQVVLRSEQRTTEESNGGRAPASGVPGVDSNVPDARGAGAVASRGGDRGFSRQNETLNYEVGRVVQRVIEAPGEIKRLSVAVLIDGREAGDGKKGAGEGGPASFVPRSPEELKKFEEIIKRSVGFNEQRGDQISLVNVPFRPAPADAVEAPQAAPEGLPQQLSPYLNYGLTAVVVLLLFLFVLRPLLAWLTRTGEEIAFIQQLPKSLRELEAELALPASGEGRKQLADRDQLQEFARQKPEVTTQLLKTWLKEGAVQHGSS